MSFDPVANGWSPLKGVAFIDRIGPFWIREEAIGHTYGFVAEAHHLNEAGRVHGGMLMSFLDHALANTVLDHTDRHPCVTVQLDTHFVSVVMAGDFVQARTRIVRRTNTLVFLQGSLLVGEKEVLTASGIWKLLAHKPERS